MSLWSKIDDAIEMARVCATGIEAIRALVKKQPLGWVHLVEKVVDGVFDALSDKRPLAEVRAEVVKIRDGLASEDAAADAAGAAALDKRFPK